MQSQDEIIPLHPGSKILRQAIRQNIVSFPARIPSFPKGSLSGMQWRAVLLFFIRGWSLGQIAGRFQVPRHRVLTLLNSWSVRALALGYIQVIDAEAFAACCGVDGEGGLDRDAGAVAWTAHGRDALPPAPPAAGCRPVNTGLIDALDAAVAHCEQWQGEYWMRTAAHLRDLRTAALAALESGRASGRGREFFTAARHVPAREKERVSHAVA